MISAINVSAGFDAWESVLGDWRETCECWAEAAAAGGAWHPAAILADTKAGNLPEYPKRREEPSDQSFFDMVTFMIERSLLSALRREGAENVRSNGVGVPRYGEWGFKPQLTWTTRNRVELVCRDDVGRHLYQVVIVEWAGDRQTSGHRAPFDTSFGARFSAASRVLGGRRVRYNGKVAEAWWENRKDVLEAYRADPGASNPETVWADCFVKAAIARGEVKPSATNLRDRLK